jgi:hypothetical protein
VLLPNRCEARKGESLTVLKMGFEQPPGGAKPMDERLPRAPEFTRDGSQAETTISVSGEHPRHCGEYGIV